MIASEALNRHIDQAFSIIELMVIVAIIGILAAVSVPAYKSYIITARLSALIPQVNSIVDNSLRFSSINGRFGNAYDQGFSSTPGSAHADSPSSVNSAFRGLSITDSDEPQCGRRGYLNAYLDRDQLGFSSDIVDTNLASLGVQCTFWHYQGYLYKKCYYYYGTQSTSQTDSLLPGDSWFNVNAGTNWDFTNRATNVYALDSYVNSTCQ